MIGIKLEMEECTKCLGSAYESVETSLTDFRDVHIPVDQVKKMLEFISKTNNYH
jgi:hypothetical protein